MKTLVVGDVHGCRAELERLLDVAGYVDGDRLILAGDVAVRGPDSRGVLRVARETGALVVRGNHDAKLLSWRRDGAKLGKAHLAVARELDDEDWAVLEATPLYLSLPEHQALVVHAGLVPGVPIEAQEPETLLFVRTVGEGKDAVLWGARYVGPPHVVFGHNAVEKLQIHPWATGLDTGCVYGGALTALVLAEGQSVPMDREARLRHLVSVPAERVHFDPARG